MPKKNPRWIRKGFRLYPDLKWQHQRIKFKTQREAVGFMRVLRRLLGGTKSIGWWCGPDKALGIKKGKLDHVTRWFVVLDSKEYVNLRPYLFAWRGGVTYQRNHGTRTRQDDSEN